MFRQLFAEFLVSVLFYLLRVSTRAALKGLGRDQQACREQNPWVRERYVSVTPQKRWCFVLLPLAYSLPWQPCILAGNCTDKTLNVWERRYASQNFSKRFWEVELIYKPIVFSLENYDVIQAALSPQNFFFFSEKILELTGNTILLSLHK